MAQTIPVGLSEGPATTYRTGAHAAVPWFVWTGVLSVYSIAFGLYWDISWHMTIGRDTFWTPAHLAIHFGGILAAITCTYLIFSATFGGSKASRESAVRIWGFRGPLGAFLTAWGGVTMLASAPFDNWWHNSFGLDVEILSPPHVVLGIGILAVVFGVMFLLVSQMNRTEGEARDRLRVIFFCLCGVQLFLHLMLISEYSDPNLMHSAIFYRFLSFGAPFLLIWSGRVSGQRWGSTIIASIYTVIGLAALWLMPLFPAHPRLGPVYTNVTHMVPMGFPLLVILPAAVLDTVFHLFACRPRWFTATIAGLSWVATLVAVHWPWGEFMISPLARNWFFGMNYFPYQMPPAMYQVAYQFQQFEPTRGAFIAGMGLAAGSAIISSRLGITFGNWLLRLRR